MKPLDFLHTEAVHRVLERSARATATPLYVHYVARKEEGRAIVGFGQCEACRYVSELFGGGRACRASRVEGSTRALEHGKATGFVCHMGFGCVSVPILGSAAPGFVLTLGPYCPAEEPRSLEREALDGLKKLHAAASDGFIESLSEIRVVPADAVFTMAEWTVEVLLDLWQTVQETSQPAPEEAAPEEETQGLRRKPGAVTPDPYHAADIAAALAGGNQARARGFVRAALAEVRSGPRARIAVSRARTVALVAGVLEAAERAEVDVRKCWEQFGDLLDDVKAGRTDEQLSAAALGLLGVIKRKAKRQPKAASFSVAKLNELIMALLPGKVVLRDIAAELGVHPTAITHRLQRKFGMSFGQYLGRIRVDKAKELLRRTRLSVVEIARRVGASDASNFNKLFRKFEHMTPLEYRKQFGSKR